MNKVVSLRKIMGISLFVILFLITAMGIFKLPSIYFSIKEENLLERIYERHLVPINIAPEAEEIYMVRAIRDIYWLNIRMNYSDEGKIEEEYEVLSKVLEHTQPLQEEPPLYTLEIMEKIVYLNDGMSLFLYNMIWGDSGGTCFSFHQESKTGKIIFMASGNTDLLKSDTYYNYVHNENDMAEKFCEYLGLDILDDWTFTSEGLISNKASLKIICYASETEFVLYAAPLESQWEHGEKTEDMEFQEAIFLFPTE